MDEISLADELGDEFVELQKEFLDTTRARVEELVRLLEAAAGQVPAGDDGDEFRRIAHSVRGSGGSYGYGSISEVAGALEAAYVAGESVRCLSDLVQNLAAELATSRERTLGAGC